MGFGFSRNLWSLVTGQNPGSYRPLARAFSLGLRSRFRSSGTLTTDTDGEVGVEGRRRRDGRPEVGLKRGERRTLCGREEGRNPGTVSDNGDGFILRDPKVVKMGVQGRGYNGEGF